MEHAVKVRIESLHQAIKRKEEYELKAAGMAAGKEHTLLHSYVDEYSSHIDILKLWLEKYNLYHME